MYTTSGLVSISYMYVHAVFALPSVPRVYSGLEVIEQGYSSQKLQTTFRKFYGCHTALVHKFDTFESHMLKGLFTNYDI